MERQENHIEDSKPTLVRGSGDLLESYGTLVREIGQQSTESIYLLTRFIDNTFTFQKVAQGNEGEVSFEFSKLTIRKGILGYEIYHNHPSGGPPSNDDFMIVATTQEYIIHKIITQEGIWIVSLENALVAKKHSQKLGSLFGYLLGETDEGIVKKMKQLDSIHGAYKDIAQSYQRLETNNATKEDYIKFREGMKQLGFKVDFISY